MPSKENADLMAKQMRNAFNDERERRMIDTEFEIRFERFLQITYWNEAGPGDDPTLRLLSDLSVLHACIHIEAIRITENQFGKQILATDSKEAEEVLWISERLAELEHALIGDGGFQAVEIEGKKYAVFIYPASDK